MKDAFPLLNIPEHKNCINCGCCCGVIPVSPKEFQTIKEYLKTHEDALSLARKATNIINCPFRDDEKKLCAIYPVRPIVCRLFGVTDGMECPNGNSANIDGRKFRLASVDEAIILNVVDWRKL